MNDEPDKREGKDPKQNSGKDPKQDLRRDRLKLALRENLKKRKSHAKARSGVTIAPSEGDGLSPHDQAVKPSE